MKKIIGIVILILMIFVILVYWSLHIKPEKVQNSILINFETIDKVNFYEQDSILIEATNRYKGNELKKLMQGEHYRKAWSTPIKVPVVFLDTLLGGMKIIREGGGKQTQSLKLSSPNGILYTLRSINKKPDALVPEIAKTLGLENIVVDGISAQHPYGAVVASKLSEQVGVLHTFPKIVFIPKQTTLDSYNEVYGNRLFLFEYETDSKINWTKYSNVTEIIDTEKLQDLKFIQRKKVMIDQHALVRARLFDLVIGDWDRHAKQWGWLIQQVGDHYNAIPLPTDRDNAFFNLGGVIPNMIANRNVRPEMQTFKNDIDYLPGLVQPFDIYFLQNVPESIFIEEAVYLQKIMTDDVIETSLQEWPKEIYDLDAKEIADKLKARRTDLIKYAVGFKKILDEQQLLTEPLKGSEDLSLSKSQLECFECGKE